MVFGSTNFPDAEATAPRSFAFGRGKASGINSVALGGEAEASGAASFAHGNNTTVSSGLYSFAHGVGSEATREGAVAFNGGTASVVNTFAFRGEAIENSAIALSTNDTTIANDANGVAIGGGLTTRNRDHVVVGLNNEQFSSGSGTVTAEDRIFSVGSGDGPASVGSFDYLDGRNNLDALYVTRRNGTHVRHGLTVDKYNDSLGQYEPQFEVLDDGRIELYDPGAGVVLRSQSGTRFEVTVDDQGTITTTQL